jgi:hypothetical protein
MGALQIVIGVATVLQGGAVAVLVWVFRRIIRGDLVPRSVLEDVRKDRDERVHDARETTSLWQDAHAESERGRSVYAGQVTQLLELGRTSEAVLRALPRVDKEPQG